MLSIGATSAPFSVADKANASALEWNVGMVDLMFQGQAEAALAQTRLMLQGRLHRLDAAVPGGTYSLDDARPEVIEQLASLGRAEAVKVEHIKPIRDLFLNGLKAEMFVPLLAVKGSEDSAPLRRDSGQSS